jgi:NADH-quinone oxidoreductase subunit L
MTVPLIILAVLSLLGGFIELPASIGNIHLFSDLVYNTLPLTVIHKAEGQEILFQSLSAIIALAGIYLAYSVYFKKPAFYESVSHSRINKFFEKGWGFDKLYNTLFVNPAVWLAEINKNDFFDSLNIWLSGMALLLNRLLSIAQNGKLRWYLMSLVIGIAVILTYMLVK